MHEYTSSDLIDRQAPLAMSADDFRQFAYQIIEQLVQFFQTLADHPVAPQTTPEEIRSALAATGAEQLPEQGGQLQEILSYLWPLLLKYSVFNGHPRFMGFITSSAAPVSTLADMLAAGINANVVNYQLAPIATEIEAQTVRWLAELIGYPTNCGGILSSGGNMGNFISLLTARKAKIPWDVRTTGLAGGDAQRLRLYATSTTHSWLHKAADLSGLGLNAICWIPTDAQQRMDVAALRTQLQSDLAAGLLPFLVIGNAGTVSTGAVDPLLEIARICREFDLWFHVDAAYGGFATMLLDDPQAAEVPADLRAIADADSVAVDPHKWLYIPIESGCTLVRDAHLLHEAFTPDHPDYYPHVVDDTIQYHEYGPQNTRGFRALKIWLALRQVGKAGYRKMLSDDITLACELYRMAAREPELEAYAHNLSTTTFRYRPPDLAGDDPGTEPYLNKLNHIIMDQIQESGLAFISNAIADDVFLLRACIVNFRTSLKDIEALIELVLKTGQLIDNQLRPKTS